MAPEHWEGFKHTLEYFFLGGGGGMRGGRNDMPKTLGGIHSPPLTPVVIFQLTPSSPACMRLIEIDYS